MPGLDELPLKDWGKSEAPAVRPLLLARGTLESIDMAKTRRLAEVLGFIAGSLGVYSLCSASSAAMSRPAAC